MSHTVQTDRLVDDQKIGSFNIKLLVLSWLAMFADGYDISAMAFAAPELVRQWHVPPGGFGLIFSAPNFGVLIGAPLLGFVGDRYGRRTAIIIGSVIFGGFTLAMMWATNLDQMLALRFITGIGIGGLMPNTIALNSELSPRRWRGMLVVLMFTGITLGSGTPGPVAAWLVPEYGWKILFLIGGLVPLIAAVVLWFVLPESVKFLARHPSRRAELLQVARRMRPDLSLPDDTQFVTEARPAATAARSGGGFLGLGHIFRGGLAFITPLLWVCFATTLMANYFLNNWMPLIFESNGVTPKQAAIASTLYHVGGTIGGVVVSLLLNRFGYTAITLLFLLAAPTIAAIGLEGLSPAMLAGVAGLAGLAVLGAQFGNNACAGMIYPTEARSQGAGWALAIGRVGSIIGPIVGGVLVAMKMPFSTLFLWASLPMALGLVAAILLAWLCFRRFRAFTLDDKPAEPDGAPISPARYTASSSP
ncbi:MAG TPA: MFS transporter [Steroidobacteraceae bacterium]|nr:MFS transporter [Steroidobacteraceae bacterium]